MNRLSVITAVLLLGVLAFVALWWTPGQQNTHSTLTGNSGPQGGDFVLQSKQGPVALQDLRGKIVLLYFGYTWCPDVCPTSLALLAQGLHGMSQEELRHVQGLFISVDPQRDTLERLTEYGGYFHPNIMGITGTAEQVADVARMYGAVYRTVGDTSKDDYIVDHSSFTTVIDQNGQIYKVLPHGSGPELITQTVRELLAKGQVAG